MAREILFLVEDAAEGGYLAQALGHSIYTQASTWEELRRGETVQTRDDPWVWWAPKGCVKHGRRPGVAVGVDGLVTEDRVAERRGHAVHDLSVLDPGYGVGAGGDRAAGGRAGLGCTGGETDASRHGYTAEPASANAWEALRLVRPYEAPAVRRIDYLLD
jgi:hypothetical protein